MWHQPEDARSLNSRVDSQSVGSRSNLGIRGRRQAHQSPHHSLSRAFGEHVRKAYNRYEQDHGDRDIRRRGNRHYNDDRRPSRERRYERRERRPGEEDEYRRRRHRRQRHDDRYHRDRSRDRQYRERDRSDFEHNFNARMQRWMNGGAEQSYGRL